MRAVGVLLVLAACSYSPSAGTDPSDGSPGDGVQTSDAPLIDAPLGAWLAPWTHRKSITIHANQVTAPTGGLIDFPVLITLADPEIAAIAREDGTDLAITGADATTLLSWEVERYAAGAATIWVKVPVLDDAADTRLYLYYGNASPPAAPDHEDVWTNQFLAVWHLSDNPNAGAAGDIKDTTANDHDGQAESSMTTSDLILTGPTGPAIDFDGSNDFIDVPTAINLGNSFTLSAWVRLQGGTGIKTVFSNSLSGLNITGCRLFVDSDLTSDRMVIFETSNGDAPNHRSATTDINRVPAGVWTHIAVIANRTAGTARILINGIDRTVSDTIRTDFANNASVELGRMGDIFEWPGSLDEIEIASERRSTEWIGTTVSNQSEPGDFFELGPQELDPN